ncbi:hypothetical protein BTJ40_16655 [Microbulbifer sp. A4B17]|uniref:hypothetical protein n=1 Tax=Microbulbifer sp. A4B17 TaxID=359370 RepID=UPI000D52C44D|nr:hypothetical protein [Microbulbifer sp. A4B17]AWF82327.1 hypothetical protein BTJ40_16655 [Microbulbifer sp. A4B17]
MDNPDIVREIEQFIDYLVQAGVYCREDQLESVYHRDMKVFILDPSSRVTVADKTAFIDMFKAKRDAGELPLNDWKKIHHVAVNKHSALVIFSRKNNLSGQEQLLKLAIDIVHEDGRWQVMREVIFLEPALPDPT